MVATSIFLQLQKAIGDRIKADSVLFNKITGVFDEPQQGQVSPYITIGDGISSSFRTHSGHGEEILTTIHVWSRATSFKEVIEIFEDLNRLFADVTDLVITGFDFIASWYDGSQTFRDDDGETMHGTIDYRIRATQTRV